MTDISLKLEDRTAALKTSPAWTVAINDFSGAVPAEMHLVRKRDGKDAGLVWLGALELPDHFDMASGGEKLLRDFLAKQSPELGEAKLLSGDRLATSEGAGGEKRSLYRTTLLKLCVIISLFPDIKKKAKTSIQITNPKNKKINKCIFYILIFQILQNLPMQ